MAKTAERTTRELTSAEIIRELRGPLPEDDPEYQAFLARGPVVRSPEETEAVEAVLRDLKAIPEGQVLSLEEVFALVQRLPFQHDQVSSAEIIREMRGPLPEDDPDFSR